MNEKEVGERNASKKEKSSERVGNFLAFPKIKQCTVAQSPTEM